MISISCIIGGASASLGAKSIGRVVLVLCYYGEVVVPLQSGGIVCVIKIGMSIIVIIESVPFSTCGAVVS